jgi:hypothetical protein
VPRTGADLLTQMHDAYAGKWFHTVTFVQQTTLRAAPDSTPHVQTWYEAILSPDRLRIDIGDPAEQNGVVTTADSTYVVRGGAVTRSVARGNPFLPFVAGVYTQPVEQTLQQIQQYHFDLTRVRRDEWQGRPVFVVGARDTADLESPQFWVDTERLIVVRMLLPLFANGQAKAQDIRLDKYVPLGGSWLATHISMRDGELERQAEDYTEYHADTPVPEAFFDAAKWKTTPHWATAKGK